MSSVNFDAIASDLKPFATMLQEFEAEETQPRTPTGSRRDWTIFHNIVCRFFGVLADSLRRELSHETERIWPDLRDHVVERENKYWLMIRHQGRTCYLPRLNLPHAAPGIEKAPTWLSCQIPRAHTDLGLRETPAWHGHAEGDGGKTRRRCFSFRHSVGFSGGGQPPTKLILEYITGKSSDNRRLDGNAHERLAYKMLQYVELAHDGRQPCELVVLGNGAFLKYHSVFYPSIQLHRKRLLSTFPNCGIAFCFENEHFLGLAKRIVDWLAPPLAPPSLPPRPAQPLGVIRRRRGEPSK